MPESTVIPAEAGIYRHPSESWDLRMLAQCMKKNQPSFRRMPESQDVVVMHEKKPAVIPAYAGISGCCRNA